MRKLKKLFYALATLFTFWYFLGSYNNAKICNEAGNKLERKNNSNILGDENEITVMMKNRTDHIRNICERYESEEDNSCVFAGRDVFMKQDIHNKNHFLKDPKTGTIYCFNHKVASSSWMSVYAHLENNPKYLLDMMKTRNYYKVQYRLSPSIEEVLRSNETKFLVVRHPFDRLLSAFLDRILNPGTDQAKYHVPQMRRNNSVDEPTFRDFLAYVAGGAIDPHWRPYHEACSPCLVSYQWILRLEDPLLKAEEEELMNRSGMGVYTGFAPKNMKTPGGTSSKNRQFYRDVDCDVLKSLHERYQSDFLLFQYHFSEYLQGLGKSC